MDTSKWQATSKELPQPQETVVILLHSKIPVIAKFNGIEFTDDGLEFENVTHWLKLPEPPKN